MSVKFKSSETVECPTCREDVKIGAKVCPHCRGRMSIGSPNWHLGSMMMTVGILMLFMGLFIEPLMCSLISILVIGIGHVIRK